MSNLDKISIIVCASLLIVVELAGIIVAVHMILEELK